MAISKAKTLANGATGSYWKISSMRVDKNLMKATFEVNLYVDQAHATAGQALGSRKVFTFPVTKAQLVGDVVELGYASIAAMAKPDPDLAGGTKV